MWGSKITRELILQKISLLAMLGPIREGERENRLISDPGQGRSMTVEQEAEIVSNLSFLSYRRKDPQTVTAICIEEDEDGQGMIVRMTVNGGAIAYVKDGLGRICAVLEQASRCGMERSGELDRIALLIPDRTARK